MNAARQDRREAIRILAALDAEHPDTRFFYRAANVIGKFKVITGRDTGYVALRVARALKDPTGSAVLLAEAALRLNTGQETPFDILSGILAQKAKIVDAPMALEALEESVSDVPDSFTAASTRLDLTLGRLWCLLPPKRTHEWRH